MKLPGKGVLHFALVVKHSERGTISARFLAGSLTRGKSSGSASSPLEHFLLQLDAFLADPRLIAFCQRAAFPHWDYCRLVAPLDVVSPRNPVRVPVALPGSPYKTGRVFNFWMVVRWKAATFRFLRTSLVAVRGRWW